MRYSKRGIHSFHTVIKYNSNKAEKAKNPHVIHVRTLKLG